MKTATDVVNHSGAGTTVSKEGILALARFCSPNADAVSFYFCRAEVADNAHREEKISVKDLVQEAIGNAPEPISASLMKDVKRILTVAEDIRISASRLRIVLACGGENIWKEFALPFARPEYFLQFGRRFSLAPLIFAMQSISPYGVVLLESGKARAFIVHGTEIEEILDRLEVEDLSLRAQDSRVGWSSHIDGNQREHEKAYFKELFHQLHGLTTEHYIDRLVIGCREDLWGEIESQFADLRKNIPIGRFHLPNFAIDPPEVLRLATPLFEENQRMRVMDVLREINESSSRSTYGVNDVMLTLMEGRVQKLVLGQLREQNISECKSCGRMAPMASQKCIFCDSADICCMTAEEGLLRQALLTDAEILFVEEGAAPGFDGAAALLRY